MLGGEYLEREPLKPEEGISLYYSRALAIRKAATTAARTYFDLIHDRGIAGDARKQRKRYQRIGGIKCYLEQVLGIIPGMHLDTPNGEFTKRIQEDPVFRFETLAGSMLPLLGRTVMSEMAAFKLEYSLWEYIKAGGSNIETVKRGVRLLQDFQNMHHEVVNWFMRLNDTPESSVVREPSRVINLRDRQFYYTTNGRYLERYFQCNADLLKVPLLRQSA